MKDKLKNLFWNYNHVKPQIYLALFCLLIAFFWNSNSNNLFDDVLIHTLQLYLFGIVSWGLLNMWGNEKK